MRSPVECVNCAQDVADGRVNPQEITEDTISGYLDTAGCSGSGSADPNQRRTETVQFPDVAAGIYGVLFYRCCMAGFS